MISGDKIFCSAKCYKDDKNTIKEIEGGEEEDENDNKNIDNDKNKEEIENIEDNPIFSNEIDILDI